MSQPEARGSYHVQNDALVQGQVIGDQVTVHMHAPGAASSTPAPSSPWMVPFPRNPFFLGQHALLEEMHRRVHRGTTPAVRPPLAITGLGGMGKTHLALEYAYRFRDHYAFVFWVRAEHRETLNADMASLAEHLHLPQHREADQSKTVAAVRQWLATHQGWLPILDNVEDLALLTGPLPTVHAGAVVLTTRVGQPQPLAVPLEVGPLDERTGAELLLHRARLLGEGQALDEAAEQDQQAARQLCRCMGGLPLALDQAGAYIDEVQCTVADYLGFYQRDQQARRVLLGRRGKGSAGHPEAVATTWGLAFEQVKRASPAAADLLCACAFLDPDQIPEEVLRQAAGCWSAELERVATESFAWTETVGELLKYGLVKRTRHPPTLSLHRLVQTVLRDALDPGTARDWAERTVRAVASVFPEGWAVAHWPSCKRLLPHARRCAEWMDQEGFTFAEASSLLLKLADYLRMQAWYQEAEGLYRRAVRIREQQWGPDHPQVATVLNRLANVYSDQGKEAEAEELYRRALRILEQHQGPDHRLTRLVRSNYARLLRAMGREDEATQLEGHA